MEVAVYTKRISLTGRNAIGERVFVTLYCSESELDRLAAAWAARFSVVEWTRDVRN